MSARAAGKKGRKEIGGDQCPVLVRDVVYVAIDMKGEEPCAI
jgi:hypothetical protein